MNKMTVGSASGPQLTKPGVTKTTVRVNLQQRLTLSTSCDTVPRTWWCSPHLLGGGLVTWTTAIMEAALLCTHFTR